MSRLHSPLSAGSPSDERRVRIGLDIGSTTVKAIVVDASSDELLWRHYERHETRQAEKVLEILDRIESQLGLTREACRLFLCGSGGQAMSRHIGGRFVQEVTAVGLAVEKLHPECRSVIELGGQDAKIIVFHESPQGDRLRKIPSMNDKCAGGTGAVIDKVNAKLGIAPERLSDTRYSGIKLHPVAGKCGVFAEADINSLQKQGVPEDELMASLYESIVQQNLAVLTRGNTLRPIVLLLGGPNTFIRGMREAWRHHLPQIWQQRGVEVPDLPLEQLIVAPQNGQYFAAIGAVEFGREEEPHGAGYLGTDALRRYLDAGRKREKAAAGSRGLSRSSLELEQFERRFAKLPWEPAKFRVGESVEGFIGLDGGSTSTKAVLLSRGREVLAKAYQLSRGNPIEDTVDVFAALRAQVEKQGASLEVLGVGTTGYAKDVLRDALSADVALVETVAHTMSALHYYDDVDVICDIGGQDIKIIVLENGQVKDFRLNTQCSAGNGYFLQSTAEGFGYSVEEYARVAFEAESMPTFGYGCAVFMQSDIVDYQQQGWRADEIMAGLAHVLPRNIWLYVSQIPNPAALGSHFVLQGGTQNNLAALKAQVDFIEERFEGKDVAPRVRVHRFAGESGAIGAALEAVRLHEAGRRTEFIGLDAVAAIEYTTTRNEATRCSFCKNRCLRTFIDVKITRRERKKVESKLPIAPGSTRIIIATCEKGGVERVDAAKTIKKRLDAAAKQNPNLLNIAAKAVFRPTRAAQVSDPKRRFPLTQAARKRLEARRRRETLRIGIPRVLNMYAMAPLYLGYFESLGVKPGRIVWSDYTTQENYREGAKRGAIDPCFPSKIGISHIHNLLTVHHARRSLDVIFFPMMSDLPSDLVGCQDHRACPAATATPDAVKAAYIKECDLFAENRIVYMNPISNPGTPELFERQMFEAFGELLGLETRENRRAVREGYAALARYVAQQRAIARDVLARLEVEDRLGIVVLGRPYHNDPGVSHEILDAFQKLGYPVLSVTSLPLDEEILRRLFAEEVERGVISHPLEILDVWKNCYSEATNQKVFAAKYVARHPNLVALELSSFKCGHDAPIYTAVEEIVESHGTPYFSFKDMDENKPIGSIKIRVETIAYFLEAYQRRLGERRLVRDAIEEKLRCYEEALRVGRNPSAELVDEPEAEIWKRAASA